MNKIKCVSCNNLILPETAIENNGKCAVCKKNIKLKTKSPKTPGELLEADRISPYSWSELADKLYEMMTEAISSPNELRMFDKPVMAFYASVHVYWLIEDGGFPMAAYNGPEWFVFGSIAFRELNRPSISDVLLEASKAMPDEILLQSKIGLLHGHNKKLLQEYLDASSFNKYNSLVCRSEMEVTNKTMQYVRENRNSFLSMR